MNKKLFCMFLTIISICAIACTQITNFKCKVCKKTYTRTRQVENHCSKNCTYATDPDPQIITCKSCTEGD